MSLQYCHFKNRNVPQGKLRSVESFEEFARLLETPQYTSETMAEYARMSDEQRGLVKDVGGYICGECKNGLRKRDTVRSFWAVVLDSDNAANEFVEDYKLMFGYKAVIHSTHSHTPVCQHLRVVVLLSRPVTPGEKETITRWVADGLGAKYVDPASFRSAQLMYYPSCSRDAEYYYEFIDGEPLDVDYVLSLETVERVAVIDERRAQKQQDPISKPGVVGAFCRVYSVPEAIEAYELPYDATDDPNRYTYRNGTTAAGAVVYDDGLFLYSNHGTDPAGGKLCNAFDLVRVHRFGELDKDCTHDTPATSRPSYREMAALAVADDRVRAQLEADNLAECFADFDTLPPSEVVDLPEDFTDAGNAKVFKNTYRDRAKYCSSLGWRVWDGKRWSAGDTKVIGLAMKLADINMRVAKARMAASAAEATELDIAKIASGGVESDDTKVQRRDVAAKARQDVALLRHMVRTQSASGIRAMVDLSRPLLEVKATDFDADPWDLNTPAGIVDLRTGSIRPHETKAMCSHITRCAPSSDGGEAWRDFLRLVFSGDIDLEEYVQTVLGSCAVGHVYQEKLHLAVGCGRNGKSTLFNAVCAVLGDYSVSINADVLTTERGQNRGAALATLRGKRIAICGELGEHQRISESMLKRVVSSDAMVIEEKYRAPETVIPSHHVFMFSNFLPKVGSTDDGTWRRLAVLPFNATMPTGEKDIPNYADKLVEQAGGAILAWIIEGAVRFYNAGCRITTPESVKTASEEYRQSEDWFQKFLDDRCVLDANARERSGYLYEVYRDYAAANGDFVRRGVEFTRKLEERGFFQRVVNGYKYRIGLKVDESWAA